MQERGRGWVALGGPCLHTRSLIIHTLLLWETGHWAGGTGALTQQDSSGVVLGWALIIPWLARLPGWDPQPGLLLLLF